MQACGVRRARRRLMFLRWWCANFFSIVSTLMLFLTPMLTMGVYSEERKRGTMELLMTSPVTDTEIVLGKFFASMTLLVIMLLPTADLFHLTCFCTASRAAAWRVLFCAYLGVLLLGGALLALGSFFSSLTESQLIAAILSFGAILAAVGGGLRIGEPTARLPRTAVSVCFPALRRFHARCDRYFEPDFLSQFHFSGRVSDGSQRRFDALAPRLDAATCG